jgi:hypothetical protein
MSGMFVSLTGPASTYEMVLTLWFVSIKTVQNLESRFQDLKFLSRAGTLCLRFLCLGCYALENAVIKTDHDFWTKDTWKLFEKTLFDTEHAEYVDKCLPR